MSHSGKAASIPESGKRGSPVGPWLVLSCILLGGVWLREARTGLGLPYLHHWDEPPTAGTALRMMKTGDLNPHYFHYPGLVTYANLLVDIVHYYRLIARPATGPDSLERLDQLEIGSDVGDEWSVSHPSFYRSGRRLAVFFGTASILLVFLIGRRVFGTAAGLLGATILAILPLHIEHSAYITTDVPLAFFVLLTAWFSIRFLEEGIEHGFWWSAVATGLVVATKYNGVVAGALPAAALFANRKLPKTGLRAFALVVVPALVFFALNPFIVADLATFLRDSGFELRHYRVVGHTGADMTPGWPHFALQLRTMRYQMTLPLMVCAAAGLAGALVRSPAGRLLVLFPILYTTLMCSQRVSFHRNFVTIYPFLAIFGAGALAGLAELVRRHPSLPASGKARGRLVRKWLPILGAFAVVIASLRLDRTIAAVRRAAVERDTRSIAVDRTNAIASRSGLKSIRIGISESLRIHRLDRNQLDFPSTTFSQDDLESALSRFDYLLVTRVASREPGNPRVESENRAVDTLPAGSILEKIGGREALIDGPAVSPAVWIVRSSIPRKEVLARFVPQEIPGQLVGFHSDLVWTSGAVATLRGLDVELPAGQKTLIIETRGWSPPGLMTADRPDFVLTLDSGLRLANPKLIRKSFAFPLPDAPLRIQQIRIESRTFVPKELDPGSTDGRTLGIDVAEIRIE